jgi:galactokinase/mevalonate kinase-like predicted kinase
VADVSSGTGLDSSVAFTVALLKALAHARGTSIVSGSLAEAVSHIDIDVLRELCGKQDTYFAAHGGHLRLHLQPRRTVDLEPLELSLGDPPGAHMEFCGEVVESLRRKDQRGLGRKYMYAG